MERPVRLLFRRQILCDLMHLICKPFVWLFLTFALFANTGIANDYGAYRKVVKILMEPQPRPTISSIASGFGSSKGTAFASINYSDFDLQTKDDGDNDGSIAIGMGFGDPSTTFGSELVLGITSVSTKYWGDGSFGDEGNFSFKIHKVIEPLFGEDYASMALGISNVIGWGGTKEMPSNGFVVYSGASSLGQFSEYGLLYSMGYGSAVGNGESESDLFGGLALARYQVSSSLSFIGPEAYLSFTYYPQFMDLSLSYTRADILDKLGQKRNILTLSYSRNIGN